MSTYLKRDGLMVNFLQDNEYLVPYLQETTTMTYSDGQVISSLGSLQDKLKLLNLVENYLFILIGVLLGMGGITLAVGPRFQKYFRREQLGNNPSVLLYQTIRKHNAFANPQTHRNNLKSTIINGVDMDEVESVKDMD